MLGITYFMIGLARSITVQSLWIAAPIQFMPITIRCSIVKMDLTMKMELLLQKITYCRIVQLNALMIPLQALILQRLTTSPKLTLKTVPGVPSTPPARQIPPLLPNWWTLVQLSSPMVCKWAQLSKTLPTLNIPMSRRWTVKQYFLSMMTSLHQEKTTVSTPTNMAQ